MKKHILFSILVLLSWFCLCAGRQSNSSDFVTMKGRIGPYKIVMHFDPAAQPGKNCGYYYYTDKKSSKGVRFRLVMGHWEAINAHGSMHIVLYEYAPNGTNSGRFDGQFECRGELYEGTFTNSNGKTYRFKLE